MPGLGSRKQLFNLVTIPKPGDWTPHPPMPLKANTGVVVVVMDEKEEKRGEILLPKVVAGHIRCDTGTVVACGAKRYLDESGEFTAPMDVQAGDRVLVLPMAGVWWRDCRVTAIGKDGFKEWRGREVRFYGIVSEDEYAPRFEDLFIMAVLEEKEIVCKRDWVLIKKDPAKHEKSGLLLPDSQRLGKWTATVFGASDSAREAGITPGCRVIYHAPATVVDIDFTPSDYGLPGEREDYAFVRHQEAYGVLEA